MAHASPPPPSRPFVQVNCAVSADGRLAYAGGKRARLSGPDDLRRVQQIRAGCDAILVGVGTVLLDDPSLRVHWELLDPPRGKDPLRVIVDSRGRTPESARVLDTSQPTLIATTETGRRSYPAHVTVFATGGNQVDLSALLEELIRRGVKRLLVEGGAQVIASFLRAGLVDRLTVFVAPVVIGGTTAPPMVTGRETLGAQGAIALQLIEVSRCDDGLLIGWELRSSAPAQRAVAAQSPQ